MKSLSNLLKILGFVSLSLVSTGFGDSKYLGLERKNFNKETFISKFNYVSNSRLKINNDTNVRFVVERREEEAISDMYSELTHTLLEESWLFNKNNNIWYEVGKSSKFIGDSKGRFIASSIQYKNLSKEIIRKTLKEQPNLPQYFVHYHVHPFESLVKDSFSKINNVSSGDLDKLNKMSKRAHNNMYGVTSKAIKDAFKGIKKARPSIMDIRKMFYEEITELKMSPFIHSNHKIRSQYGITEYHLTDEAIEYFVKEKNKILNSSQLKDYILEKEDNGEFYLKNNFLLIHFIPNNALRSYYSNKEKTKH